MKALKVTKQVYLEREQKAEANLSAIIENADGLVYSIDRDFKYITLNTALKTRLKQLFGVDAQPGDRIYGFLEKTEPEAALEWRNIYARAFSGERLKFVKEFTYTGKSEYWSFSINPIWQKGAVTGLACFSRNITEIHAAKAALKSSEEKYRLIFRNNPLPCWVFDEETLQFIDVNDAAIRNYGYSRQQFLSMSITDIRLQQKGTELVNYVQAKKSARALQSGQLKHIKRNGELIDVEVITCPMFWEGRRLILALAEDITEKKKIEEKIRASEERYRLVAENPIVGVGWASLQGQVLYANETLHRMLGYELYELHEIHFGKITHPADMEWELPLFEKLVRGEVDNYKVEKRYLTKLNGYIWAELNLTKVKDHTGFEYCIGIIQDITQRKLAEERIKNSEERYRRLSQNEILGIVWASAEGRVLNANEAFYKKLGYSYLEILDMPYTRFTHPDAVNLTKRYLKKLFSGKVNNVRIEKRYITKTGDTIWCELNLSAVKDSMGRVKYSIGVAQDITARKNAEAEIMALNASLEKKVAERTAQLEQANKELEAFSYTVAHDLRAPLRVINGLTDIVVKESYGKLSGDSNHLLTQIQNNAVMMSQLVHDLLEFSRFGKTKVVPVVFNMQKVVHQVMEVIRLSEPDFKCNIQLGCLADSKGDPGLIKQVWINLISNAVKYSRKAPEPVVEIGCGQQGDETVYYVKDNGAGFDMQMAGKLFQVFHRLHKKSEFEGTGVGLALVHRIISKHNGRIWANAEVNKGATFYFTLPGQP